MSGGIVQTEHFNWRQHADGAMRWTGSRNATALMTISYDPTRVREDGRPYVLASSLPGHTSYRQGFETLAQAQEGADKRWAEWVHMMGLKLGDA